VAAILTSIQSLLHDPNPNSPANAEAAQLYRENMKEYVRRVRATVEDSWLEDDEKAAAGEEVEISEELRRRTHSSSVEGPLVDVERRFLVGCIVVCAIMSVGCSRLL